MDALADSLSLAEKHVTLCAVLQPADALSQLCRGRLASVLPYARVAKAFPRALEAVIVRPSTPPEECERAWELRRQLMLEYGLDGGLAAPPVLIYDPAARHAFTTTGQGCGGG